MKIRSTYKAVSIIALIGLFAFSPIQLFKTNLKVTVLNTAGNPEEGAEVQLFSNFEDFEKETNPITEKNLTDEKGVANFKDLEAKSYFVMVRKDEFTNIGMGTQTDTLSTRKVNKVNIIID